MGWHRDATEGWAWHPTPTIRDGRGPERVEVGTPDPTYQPRPVGFTAHLDTTPTTEAATDPWATWDGDGA